MSAAIVGVAWAAFWLPTKAFHASGAPPAGYLTALGYHVLMPGAVASLFLFRLDGDSLMALTAWNVLLVALNWVFYFVALVGIGRLRRPRAKPPGESGRRARR